MIFRRAVMADVPATVAVHLAVRKNVLENPDRVTKSLVKEYIEERGEVHSSLRRKHYQSGPSSS